MGTNYHSLFDLERGFVVSLEVMKKILSLAFLSCILLIAPMMTLARGLVPCGGPGEEPCQTCHVVSLTQNVIGWLVAILSVIAAIVIVYAGIKLVTSGGNQSAMESAKSMISNVIIGYIIVLAGWLLIDFGMKSLVDQGDFGVWNVIECVVQPVAVWNDSISRGSAGLTAINPDGTFALDSGLGTQGACTIAPSGACSLSAIQAAGFGNLSNDAALIAGAESGCNPNSESRTDTTSDGRTYSVGTWQINLSSTVLSCDGVVLDCPSAFRYTGRRNNFGVKIQEVINESLYQQCLTLAKQPSCNNSTAATLARNSGDMGDWACSAKKCGVDTTRNSLCPL